MKVTFEMTPEEAKEMFGFDKIQDIGLSTIQAMQTEYLSQMNKNIKDLFDVSLSPLSPKAKEGDS